MSKTTSDRAWAVLAAWVEGLGLSPENRKRGYQRIHDYADARAALKGDAEMDAGPLSRTDPIRCLVERLEARIRELEAALADLLAMLRESLHYGRACGQLAEAVGMEASDLAIPADFVARAEKAIEEAAALLREKGDTHDA